MLLERTERIRDPIHGFIKVNKFEMEIINSEPFQRLRRIKQLALTCYVYPGAEHTRFSHSLGVLDVATRAFESAVQNFLKTEDGKKEEVKKLFSDVKCDWYIQILRLVALTHDLGHPPFSHAGEGLMPKAGDKGKRVKHEFFTEQIIKNTEIKNIIVNIGIAYKKKYGSSFDITADLICEVYNGNEISLHMDKGLFLINSLMDSELDCDKMDYLLRDSYYCGVSYGKYDIDRLLSCLTICEEDGNYSLAIQESGIHAFEGFLVARYWMFIQVYFHKTRAYLDWMLESALKKCLENCEYPIDVNEYMLFDDISAFELIRKNVSIPECEKIYKRVIYHVAEHSPTHTDPNRNTLFKEHTTDILKYLKISYESNEYYVSESKINAYKPPKQNESGEKGSIVVMMDSGENRELYMESYIVKGLEPICIKRLYVDPKYKPLLQKRNQKKPRRQKNETSKL